MNELNENPRTPIAEDSFATNSTQTRVPKENVEVRAANATRVVGQLQELHDNAKLSKYRHFAAAERKLFYHRFCGWGVILIEIAIVLILLDALATHPDLAWLKIIAIFAAALATALSATQNYFDFQRVSVGHRNIANRYLEISIRCKRLLGQREDLDLSLAELWDALRALDVEYDTLNRDAEAFPTAKPDYDKALEEAMQYKPC
jgi:hypothetical protein